MTGGNICECPILTIFRSRFLVFLFFWRRITNYKFIICGTKSLFFKAQEWWLWGSSHNILVIIKCIQCLHRLLPSRESRWKHFRFNCFIIVIIQRFNYLFQTFLNIISHSFTSTCQKHLNSVSSESTVTIPQWWHGSMISVLLGNLKLICSQRHYLLPRQLFQFSWHLVHLTQGRWIWKASCFVSPHSYCSFCD